MFCFANQPKSRMFLAGWLMLSVGMLFGAPGDNVKDPIAGKIRITAGASSWDHVDDDTDSVPIELYDVVDNDYVGGATVDGYDSANWTATKGVCVPTTAAVSIVWKATGGVGGTGTATITASLYDKVDNAEADDAANLTLTVTCTGWELTAISPTTIDVLYKGQGKKQTFTATTTPASPPADVAAKISWTANGGTVNPTTGLTSEWTQDASYVSAAVDDVMIACAVGSGPKKEAKTTVVNIDKLQYQEPGSSSWTDVGATLYIVTGTSVTFKATKTPAAAAWPSGKPVWGGTAGATGTGETKTVSFTTLSANGTDYKTVTAECGDTKTANNVVFDFEGTFTSDDPFAGRTYDRFGVAEKLTLDFTTTPAGITAAQAGGLKWTKVGGVGGALTNNGNDGKGDYDCGDVATTETFKLTVQSGPSKNKQKSYDKQIVAPSGVRMDTATSVSQTAAAPVGVGFTAPYYLDPKDVSFKNLTYGEGECPATMTGYFNTVWPMGITHPANQFTSILGGNIATGCKVTRDDNPRVAGLPAPYAAGTFSWPIPQRYKKGAGGTWRVISTVSHDMTMDATGKVTIAKAGQGPFANK